MVLPLALPVEILSHILLFVFGLDRPLIPSSAPTPLAGYSSLLLVSRDFRELALPYFWRSFSIVQPADWTALFAPETGLLIDTPEGARRRSWVEEVAFTLGSQFVPLAVDADLIEDYIFFKDYIFKKGKSLKGKSFTFSLPDNVTFPRLHRIVVLQSANRSDGRSYRDLALIQEAPFWELVDGYARELSCDFTPPGAYCEFEDDYDWSDSSWYGDLLATLTAPLESAVNEDRRLSLARFLKAPALQSIRVPDNHNASVFLSPLRDRHNEDHPMSLSVYHTCSESETCYSFACLSLLSIPSPDRHVALDLHALCPKIRQGITSHHKNQGSLSGWFFVESDGSRVSVETGESST